MIGFLITWAYLMPPRKVRPLTKPLAYAVGTTLLAAAAALLLAFDVQVDMFFVAAWFTFRAGIRWIQYASRRRNLILMSEVEWARPEDVAATIAPYQRTESIT